MVDLPRVGSQRRALGLVCALAVFALIGHATSDTWGSNSTRTLQGSKLFKATTDLGQGTNVHVFGPLLNQALYGVAYNDASNNNKLWFLAISDFSAGTCQAVSAGLSTVPFVNGTAGLLTFTARGTVSGGTFSIAHMALIGGRQNNGITPDSAYDWSVWSPGSGFGTGFTNGGAYPTFARYGASLARDESITNLTTNTATATAAVPLYIFGGYENSDAVNNVLMNDMHFSTPDSDGGISAWTVVPPLNDAPEPRYQHKVVTYNDTMYLFGGRNENGTFGDTWSYHYATANWTKLHDFGFITFEESGEYNNTVTPAGTQPPYSPPSRYGHSMIRVADPDSGIIGGLSDLIVMIGGTNGLTTFNDSWGFDPVTELWQELKLSTAYAPRSHAGIFVSSETTTDLYIYGGQVTNSSGTFIHSDMWYLDVSEIDAPGPVFKRTPNAIIAGVAGGIILFLIITVIVLKCTDRNSN